MANKMTYVDALNLVLTGAVLTDEATEKLEALRDQLTKRNSSKNDKPSKKQAENLASAEHLADVMKQVGKPSTVSEYMAVDPEGLGTMSNQKVSALMRVLESAGRVEKTTEKRKSYFALRCPWRAGCKNPAHNQQERN